MENQPPQGNGTNMNYPSLPDEDVPQFGGQGQQQYPNMQMDPNMISTNQNIQITLNSSGGQTMISTNQHVQTTQNFSGGPPQQGHPYAPQRQKEAVGSHAQPYPQQNYQAPH